MASNQFDWTFGTRCMHFFAENKAFDVFQGSLQRIVLMVRVVVRYLSCPCKLQVLEPMVHNGFVPVVSRINL
jgi:hypothetical protein